MIQIPETFPGIFWVDLFSTLLLAGVAAFWVLRKIISVTNRS